MNLHTIITISKCQCVVSSYLINVLKHESVFQIKCLNMSVCEMEIIHNNQCVSKYEYVSLF